MYARAARLRIPAARAVDATAQPAGEPLVLTVSDGQPIAATWYAAAGGVARATVVIAPATGVPQGFYRRFACWLAERQFAVLTFDYRGIGRSRPKRLRGFEADFLHWLLDLDAAFAHALARGTPVIGIGHSIGGLLAPLAAHAEQLQRLVLVGAQTAYWRDWPAPQRYARMALWHGFMPLLTLAAGYFPGRALRLGEDLPRGVALQWALRPWREPFAEDRARECCARALPPVHLVAASDDVFATAAAQQRVQDRLTGCEVQRHRLEPSELGLERIGHFDVFREPLVWPRLLSIAETAS